ncbi:MAG TPA: hypothetical protein VF668_08265 [Pyrinomonadaceae bacterium]|jgi:hypothetical protein
MKIALAAACAAAAAACHESSSPATRQMAESGRRADAAGLAAQTAGVMPVVAATPAQTGTLSYAAVRESSGVVASRRNPGLFWTHNDSGDGPFVYAFERGGAARGAWRVTGAQALDWEDIAAGPGPARGQSYLYVGDIGDNGRKREGVVVYRFPEPQVGAGGGADAERPRDTEPAEAIRLKYPDGARNAEALLVHPLTGDLYVVTKAVDGAGVYRLAAPFNAEGVNTLARVATLKGPDFFGSLVTGGDISPDGRRVALCDYAQGYELTLPEGARGFDEVWAQKPAAVPLGLRLQGEAVCYTLDGSSLVATSEKSPSPVIEVALPRPR